MTAESGLFARYGFSGTCACPVFYGPEALKALRTLSHGHRVLVVSDESCIRAGALALANIAVCDTVIFQDGIEPGETAVETVRRNLSECDLIVSIGSNTITDIAKYAAYLEDIPFISVATAPSTGSYISEYADIYLQKNKQTVKCRRAVAVVADDSILLKCPAVLKAAGLGTLLYLAAESVERRVGAALYAADFAEPPAALGANLAVSVPAELRAAELCFKELSKNSFNSEKGIEAVFGATLAAALAKETAPGSAGFTGAAKLVSDFIQSVCLLNAGTQGAEGETLGLGASLVCALVPGLESRIRSRLTFTPTFSFRAWENKIESVYPPRTAEKIIAAEKESQYNSPAQRSKRASAVFSHAPGILKELGLFGRFAAWFSLYEKEGGVTSYKKLGLTLQNLKNAVLFSKDLSGGFSLLQLASDLNTLTGFADSLQKK